MSELIIGKQYGGTFCPECNELIPHEIEFIPTEIYCPIQDKMVEIPEVKTKSTEYYVTSVSAKSIQIATSAPCGNNK